MKKKLAQWFGSLHTTTKISLSYGVLLAIIVVEMLIGYVALAIVWEANTAIQTSAEMQRLAMTMGRNWETARRLQREFSFQVAAVGVEEAYRVQALASSAKISEVIRDGATLRRLLLAADASASMGERVPDLDLVLNTVIQYATVFDTAGKLELRLAATDAGLRVQQSAAATALADMLTGATADQAFAAALFATRFLVEHPQAAGGSTSSALLSAVPADLRRAITASSLPTDQITATLATLDEYARISDEIVLAEAQIQEEIAVMDRLGGQIEPHLLTLMATANKEAGLARLQIAATRQTAIAMMAGALFSGFLLAVAVAVLLHFSVTRKITQLTEVAGRLDAGDLRARAPVDTTDELGQLALTLNAMAANLGLTIERLEVLRKTALALASELDLDKVLTEALTAAVNLTGAAAGCITLIQGDELVMAQTIGLDLPIEDRQQLAGATGIVAHALATRRPVIWLNGAPAADSSGLPPHFAQVAFPLLSARQQLGVLALAAPAPGCFGDDLVRFLELYAAAGAVAIDNARVYGDARHLAVVDALTGLYNRRGLFQYGKPAIRRVRRRHLPISAIFVDVDHFKQFNDRYSYAVGDLVLRTIAATLTEHVRKVDLVCRYGGEEFVILLPDVAPTAAADLAERLRKAVAAQRVTTVHGVLTSTISLGVASLHSDDALLLTANTDAALLIALLDQAGDMLHVAKSSGRNCIAIAGGPRPADPSVTTAQPDPASHPPESSAHP